MTLEARFAAMEARVEALEQENQALKAAASPAERKVSKASEWRRKSPDEQRQLVDDLTPMQRVEIRSLALDVQKYGYEQAMILHGRKLPKRGRKALY